MFRMIFYKIKAMTGGSAVFAAVLLCCVLCFGCVGSILSKSTSSSIILACVDNDDSDTSSELIDILEETDGIRLNLCTEKDAQKLLLRGQAEAVFYIDEGFEDAILSGDELPVRYIAGGAGYSFETGKEIVGGIILSMQSSYDALRRLEASYNADDTLADDYYQYLKSAEQTCPPVLTVVESVSGDTVDKPVFGRVFARYSGFVSLVIFLFIMSLSVLFSGESSKNIVRTGGCIPYGKVKALLSDFGALLLSGFIISALALIIKKSISIREWIAYFVYCSCVSGLCMLFSSFRSSGGIDMVAPLAALITGVIGGCFFDIAALGSFFRVLSYFSPQGLLISAVEGSIWPLPVMLSVTMITLFVNLLRYKKI